MAFVGTGKHPCDPLCISRPAASAQQRIPAHSRMEPKLPVPVILRNRRTASAEAMHLADFVMTEPDFFDGTGQRMIASARRHWKVLLIEGIVLTILGLLAILVPPLASVAVAIFLGWLLLISGIAGLLLTFSVRQAPGFWWALVSAIVALAAGFVLLWRPLQGTLTLTIIVGIYFVAEGVASIMYALEHRRELTKRWGWMLAAGVVNIIIAAIIITGLPGSALWAIGLLVGINLVFGGASLIAIALALRDNHAGQV